jgi:hypothetical protein
MMISAAEAFLGEQVEMSVARASARLIEDQSSPEM